MVMFLYLWKDSANRCKSYLVIFWEHVVHFLHLLTGYFFYYQGAVIRYEQQPHTLAILVFKERTASQRHLLVKERMTSLTPSTGNKNLDTFHCSIVWRIQRHVILNTENLMNIFLCENQNISMRKAWFSSWYTSCFETCPAHIWQMCQRETSAGTKWRYTPYIKYVCATQMCTKQSGWRHHVPPTTCKYYTKTCKF